MMNSILALLSPRKQANPAPSSPDELHKSHVKKAKTYSKKDRIRAQRALARISSGSEAQSERSRLSNVSSNLAPVEAETGEEIAVQSQSHLPEDDDIYDATPEPMSRANEQTSQVASDAVADTIAAVGQSEAEEVEVDEDEEEFKRFIGHHWVGDAIEIEVEWENGPSTWEPERNLHRDAPDALFAYWESQGGRPPNPEDPELYDIFAVRNHSRNKKRVLVEWVGFPETDATWLPTSAVKATAGDILKEYWESQKNKKKA